MASGTLYTYPDNFRAFKVLIAAQYSNADVKVAENFVFGETNKTEEFVKKFPLGKVPAFESNDGKCISESNAIAYYVANEQLRGKTDLEKAQILQWLSFADSEVLPASSAWVFPLLGIMPYNKNTVETAKEDVFKVLKFLDEYLLEKTFLVGEKVTLADICLSLTYLYLFKYVLDSTIRKQFLNVTRWYESILNQPEAKKVIGEVILCDKPLEFDSKKFAESQGKSGKKDKKEKAPKEEKKKEKKEKEPVEELDAAEAALAAEPKSSNPFDNMNKGTWDMDDFKRFYSNNEETKSIPYFWEKFDPENYSIWYSEYKYADELTKTFMSCNLIGGMFQRLEKMRKAAFASVCLFGSDNDSTISGIWIWRGPGLAFEMCQDWQIDYESYSWTKLDPSESKTKDLVKQYFSWEGKDKNGRPFKEGKIFK